MIPRRTVLSTENTSRARVWAVGSFALIWVTCSVYYWRPNCACEI